VTLGSTRFAGGDSDTLDVVTKNLAMTLGSALSEALATFAASSHVEVVLVGMGFDGVVSLGRVCVV